VQISASAAETSATSTLTVVDAELGTRYKALVAVHPLMSDVIPEGQLNWLFFSHPIDSLVFFPQPSATLLQRMLNFPMDKHKGNDL